MTKAVKTAAALILLAALPAPALAETDFQTLRYICDRDVEIPATYVNAEDLQVAVIHVEGWQITLLSEMAASGARYSWPSGGASYVWWTKGTEASLYWREAGEEKLVLSCTEAQ